VQVKRSLVKRIDPLRWAEKEGQEWRIGAGGFAPFASSPDERYMAGEDGKCEFAAPASQRTEVHESGLSPRLRKFPFALPKADLGLPVFLPPLVRAHVENVHRASALSDILQTL